MIKTYSERRQTILFRAARDMRKVAVDVLDEVTRPEELVGNTAPWAMGVAQRTAELANTLETQGHEQSVATARQETDLYESRRAYGLAIDRFEARLREQGVDPRSLDEQPIQVHKIGS